MRSKGTAAFGRLTIPCEWCGNHFEVWLSASTRRFCSYPCSDAAMRAALPTLWDRFWPKVYKSAGCWWWTAATRNGYGVIGRGGSKGGQVYAHRQSYEWANGAIPPGLDLDHLCRNRACVNPEHLEAVSRKENLRRSPLMGRYQKDLALLRTHCLQGHPLAGDNVRINPDGSRSCRTCGRERRRIYLAAHREEERVKNREYHRQGRRKRSAGR